VPNPKPPYRPEFRTEAVRLARQPGNSVRQVARDLGVANESLRRWIKEQAIESGDAVGLTAAERGELRTLRRRVRPSRKSGQSWQKRRPSSPGRPTGHAERVPVHRAREGQPPRDVDDGLEWLVAQSNRTIGATADFGEMLAAAADRFDVLVVGYVCRFARDLETAVTARRALHRAGAAILFADERILTSDDEQCERWAREAVEAGNMLRPEPRRRSDVSVRAPHEPVLPGPPPVGRGLGARAARRARTVGRGAGRSSSLRAAIARPTPAPTPVRAGEARHVLALRPAPDRRRRALPPHGRV